MKLLPKRFRSRRGAPGIVDVAAKAGVSPATVSRAYMTPDMVSETARKAILQAATDLGYVRERSAGTARNQYSGTIGLVVPTIDNAIFAELAAAFSEHLQTLGRTMLIASHEYDLDKELEIIRSLVDRRIDGVALIGFDHHAVPLQILSDRNIPAISLWNYQPSSGIPCIGADNRKAAELVSRHVLSTGRRDIAYVFPDTKGNDRARHRLAGCLETARALGREPVAERIVTCPYDITQAKQLGLDLLVRDRPEAFICGNDVIAHGILFACRAAGVDVPGDVSVAGIGDFRGSADMVPSLTTVRMPARAIGRLGAQSLVRMSQTGLPPDPFNRETEVQLMVRQSTVSHAM